MARFVLVDDPENPREDRIVQHEAVFQQDFHLLVAAPFGQRDDAAEAFEQLVTIDDRLRIELVDRCAKDDFDEAVDMPEGAIDIERHRAAPFEPATKHHIMFALVAAVAFDRGDQG